MNTEYKIQRATSEIASASREFMERLAEIMSNFGHDEETALLCIVMGVAQESIGRGVTKEAFFRVVEQGWRMAQIVEYAKAVINDNVQ